MPYFCLELDVFLRASLLVPFPATQPDILVSQALLFGPLDARFLGEDALPLVTLVPPRLP